MIEAITQERWQKAQAAEIVVVSYEEENSRRSYEHIFKYLGIDFEQNDKQIIEVGCGAYPAIQFCTGLKGAAVYEPLWFDNLEKLKASTPMWWHQIAFEEHDGHSVDEVWLFNCLQHVRAPEAVIAKAKHCAPVIRFFEPIDYPICIFHPHTFTQQDFERWFPNSVKRYTDRLPGFFDADCVYGTHACSA